MYAAESRGRRLTFTVEAVWRRNMIIRDRETGTLWQQATGEALYGPLRGEQLELLGGALTTWGAWCAEHPDTLAGLEAERGPRFPPRRLIVFLLEHATAGAGVPGLTPTDRRLPTNAEVVGLQIRGAARAYPLAWLRERGTLADVLGGTPITVAYDAAADRVRAYDRLNGQPVWAQRTFWAGWFEFHPETTLYRDPVP